MGLTLQEGALGCEKVVTLSVLSTCPDCTGSGVLPGARVEDCRVCRGCGEVLRTQRSVTGEHKCAASLLHRLCCHTQVWRKVSNDFLFGKGSRQNGSCWAGCVLSLTALVLCTFRLSIST